MASSLLHSWLVTSKTRWRLRPNFFDVFTVVDEVSASISMRETSANSDKLMSLMKEKSSFEVDTWCMVSTGGRGTAELEEEEEEGERWATEGRTVSFTR